MPQGELEGAKPASNGVECPAKPCSARRAAHEVGKVRHFWLARYRARRADTASSRGLRESREKKLMALP